MRVELTARIFALAVAQLHRSPFEKMRRRTGSGVASRSGAVVALTVSVLVSIALAQQAWGLRGVVVVTTGVNPRSGAFFVAFEDRLRHDTPSKDAFGDEFSADWYRSTLGIKQRGLGYDDDDEGESPNRPDTYSSS